MATGEISTMIGVPVKRKEDPRLITGQGKYTDDMRLQDMVYMEVLRSVHANARIRGIDASKAKQRPGVLGVFTGEDVIPRCVSPLPMAVPTEGIKAKTRWPLSTDTVSFVGDAVAAVVATSRGEAMDALELIKVDYEPLPAVVDLEGAAKQGSPLVHEDLGTNLCVASSGQAGDPDEAFRQADGVVSARFEEPRVVVNPMEPRAVLASYERDTGDLTLWDTTQAHHLEREEVSQVLGLPEDKVRVIGLDVGGGFGCKHPVYPETYLAALFSMELWPAGQVGRGPAGALPRYHTWTWAGAARGGGLQERRHRPWPPCDVLRRHRRILRGIGALPDSFHAPHRRPRHVQGRPPVMDKLRGIH